MDLTDDPLAGVDAEELEADIDKAIDELFVRKGEAPEPSLAEEAPPEEPAEKPAEKPVEAPVSAPPTALEDDPLAQLKESLLTLDWEITTENIQGFEKELHNVGEKVSDDRHSMAVIKMALGVLQYLRAAKGSAAPISVQFLHGATRGLDLFIREPAPTDAERSEVMDKLLGQFRRVKAEIQLSKPAAEPPPAEEVPAVTPEPTIEPPPVEEAVLEEISVEEPLLEEVTEDKPALEEIIEDEPLFEELPEEEPVVTEPPEQEPVLEEISAEEPILEEFPEEQPLVAEPPDEDLALQDLLDELPEEEPVAAAPPEEEPALEEPSEELPVLEELPDELPTLEELTEQEPVVAEPPEEEPTLDLEELFDEEPTLDELPEEEPVAAAPPEEEPALEELFDEEPTLDELPEEAPALEPSLEQPDIAPAPVAPPADIPTPSLDLTLAVQDQSRRLSDALKDLSQETGDFFGRLLKAMAGKPALEKVEKHFGAVHKAIEGKLTNAQELSGHIDEALIKLEQTLGQQQEAALDSDARAEIDSQVKAIQNSVQMFRQAAGELQQSLGGKPIANTAEDTAEFDLPSPESMESLGAEPLLELVEEIPPEHPSPAPTSLASIYLADVATNTLGLPTEAVANVFKVSNRKAKAIRKRGYVKLKDFKATFRSIKRGITGPLAELKVKDLKQIQFPIINLSPETLGSDDAEALALVKGIVLLSTGERHGALLTDEVMPRTPYDVKSYRKAGLPGEVSGTATIEGDFEINVIDPDYVL